MGDHAVSPYGVAQPASQQKYVILTAVIGMAGWIDWLELELHE